MADPNFAAVAARREAMRHNVQLLTEQAAAARRSSFPLKLWPDEPSDVPRSGWFQLIDGELHYVPLPESRAEMARSFLRAQAMHPHAAPIPSLAQLRNLPKIVALARALPIDQAEGEVTAALQEMLTCEPPFFSSGEPLLCPLLDWYALLKGSF